MGNDEHMQVGNRPSSVTERELITAINSVEHMSASIREISEDLRELRDEMREDRKHTVKRSELQDAFSRIEALERKDSARTRDLVWMTVIGSGVLSVMVWMLEKLFGTKP